MLKPLPAEQWNRAAAAHLLNRAGFGGSPSEVDALAALGHAEAVDRLVEWEKQPDDVPMPEWAKLDLDARRERFQKSRQASAEERRQLQAEEQKRRRGQILELQGWWLRRMATSARPLQEKLTLFWHGHFATSIEKVRDPYLMWLQNETLRKRGGGRWFELLDAVTRDPAMLIYLDQQQSRPSHPNENYARELMELFALGEGHYTEKDVTEAARALTGLTLDRLTLEVSFNRRRHDAGVKTVLGRTGRLGVNEVLEQVAGQPQCARFISAKLWTFFAAENPSPELVDALAAEFRRQDGRIQPFLRVVFRSEEFHAPSVVRKQIKSPVQFLVQACRQLERDLPPGPVCSNALRLLGQNLFAPPNVKGWDGGVSWINTNTLLARQNLTLLLVTGENSLPRAEGRAAGKGRPRQGRVLDRIPKGAVATGRLFPDAVRGKPDALIESMEARLLAARFRDKDRAGLREFIDANAPLDDVEVATLLRTAMCAPDYQLC